MHKVARPRPNWQEWRPALISLAESGMPLKQTMEMFCRAYVDAALEFSHGSVTHAGKLINVHRNTIARWAKLK